MSKETEIQRKVAIPFFVDKLGYEFKSPNTINWSLIIESDVERFLLKDFNVKSYNKVVKNFYDGDNKKFLSDYCVALSEAAFSKYNVAIFLKSKTFKFKGEEFILWQPSGSSFSERDLFDDNIFSITEELSYRPSLSFSHSNFHKRPDLVFFLNGIFFGYMELKHQNTQRAKDKGREKVIGNYIEAKSIFSKKDNNECRKALTLFEKAIHISASDLYETYIIRNISDYSGMISSYLKEDSGDINQITSLFFKDFPLYPSDIESNNGKEKMEKDWSNLYSKKSIENEILFYNFLEKFEGKRKDVEIEKNNIQRRLISPRPKQKFGIDKTIERISQLYKNENNDNYSISEFENNLRSLGLSENQIEKEIKSRKLLTNNTTIYSILKQYAAGFGKTKLMCWEALQLNELKDNTGNSHLFDKVILVSDRLDLKEQVSATMESMPTIEKGAWKEAVSTDDFVECLENKSCRIIVVNVQKFNFLSGKLNTKVKSLLVNYRVAFIIDEIHRSHNGQQNDRMIELFNSIGSIGGSKKKNLIIGLTATASQKILQRFGEVGALSSDGIEFKPFDAFTMKEAIEGGYVLDPVKTFVPIHIPTFIEDSDVTELNRLPGPKEYYGNSERIYKVIDHAFNALNAITFTKIRNTGKAMYVANDIPSAIVAFKYFEKKINEYENEKDKPNLYIVYSKPQDQKISETASNLNGGISEEKAISNFKKSKNAIIVVVDKLQTGFDEPTLHTIILNCERRGINMVQTLCRVNRTTKNKFNCMVLDYSITDEKTQKTKNELNAKDAFDEFAGLAISTFNAGSKKQRMEDAFYDMTKNSLFDELFEMYKIAKNDPEYDINKFGEAVKNSNEEDIANLLIQYKEFAQDLNVIEGVIELDKKYKNKLIPDFFSKIRSLLTDKQQERIPLDFYVSDIEGISITEIEGIIDETEKDSKRNTSEKEKQEDDLSIIDKLKEKILKINEFQELNELEIEKNNSVIFEVLYQMKNSDINKAGIGRLLSQIKDNPYADHSDDFRSSFRSFFRRYKYVKANNPEDNRKEKEKLRQFADSLYEFYYRQFLKIVFE